MNSSHQLRIVLIWIALLLLTSACTTRSRKGELAPDAAPDAVPDLAGHYAVNGFDPLGTEYGGSLVIEPGEEPGDYVLQWIITGSIQEGRGRLEGNQLRVEWRSVPGFKELSQGQAVYTVTVKGELYGLRTVEGYEKAGSEQAFPNP